MPNLDNVLPPNPRAVDPATMKAYKNLAAHAITLCVPEWKAWMTSEEELMPLTSLLDGLETFNSAQTIKIQDIKDFIQHVPGQFNFLIVDNQDPKTIYPPVKNPFAILKDDKKALSEVPFPGQFHEHEMLALKYIYKKLFEDKDKENFLKNFLNSFKELRDKRQWEEKYKITRVWNQAHIVEYIVQHVANDDQPKKCQMKEYPYDD